MRIYVLTLFFALSLSLVPSLSTILYYFTLDLLFLWKLMLVVKSKNFDVLYFLVKFGEFETPTTTIPNPNTKCYTNNEHK